jgi:hypothetical protein
MKCVCQGAYGTTKKWFECGENLLYEYIYIYEYDTYNLIDKQKNKWLTA